MDVESPLSAMSDLNDMEDSPWTKLSDLDSVTCAICLEVYDKPVKIRCGHTFCLCCVDKFLKVADPVCPMCRAPFDPKEHKDDFQMTMNLLCSTAHCELCAKQVFVSQLRSHVSRCEKRAQLESVNLAAQQQQQTRKRDSDSSSEKDTLGGNPKRPKLSGTSAGAVFTGRDFSGMDFSGVEFSGGRFSAINFSGSYTGHGHHLERERISITGDTGDVHINGGRVSITRNRNQDVRVTMNGTLQCTINGKQVVPGSEPFVVPRLPRIEPPVMPRFERFDTPNFVNCTINGKRVGHRGEPLVMPRIEPQVMPHVAPHAASRVAPHVAPHAAPCVAPCVASHGAPHVVPEDQLPRVQLYNCPLCPTHNLGHNELITHCLLKHDHGAHTDLVVCPICATMPFGDPTRVSVDFLSHLRQRHSFAHNIFVDYANDEEAQMRAAIEASLNDDDYN